MRKNYPTILVTGGARRLGATIARTLADEGYHIALHYRHSKAEATALTEEIGATLYPADLAKPGAAEKLITSVCADHPQLIGLVNNASTFRRADLTETTEANIAEDLQINLQAPLNLMRAFAQHTQAPSPSIVNLLDTAIYDTHPAHFAYLLAKKALGEATKMAAREWLGRIRVNAVCPGHILPTEHQPQHDPAPQPTDATPEQVAQAVLLLLQNPSYTGQFLNIDGGRSTL